MKTCSYCGTQYPDDASVCAVDQQPLESAREERKKIAGMWRGAYGFERPESLAALKPVRFTLRLKQDWLGHFTGEVVEDSPGGMPGTGTIDGYVGFPTIEFTKRMPVCCVIKPDGSLFTLRESFAGKGQMCEHNFPHPPIFYEGEFLDADRVQGTWVLKPMRIPLPNGKSLSMSQTSGIWCAEFITADTNAIPIGGPEEPFYDKSLLPQPDSTPDDGLGDSGTFRSMGKFRVAEAEHFLKRFEQEHIRFEINSDDSKLRKMDAATAAFGGYGGAGSLIEIYVHAEDEAKAVKILGEDRIV